MIESSIYYDRNFVENIKICAELWRLAWVYRSNWRVLHIDGFEGGRSIPVSLSSEKHTFFTYAEEM